MVHSAKKYNEIIFTIIGVSVILYYGQTLFIPLSFALLISFILYPVCVWMEKHKLSRTFAIVLSISILSILMIGVMVLLVQQILSFSTEWPEFKNKLLEAVDDISRFIRLKFGISKNDQEEWLKDTINNSSTGLLSVIKGIIYSSGVSIALCILIPFFSALILYNRRALVDVLYSFFARDKKIMIHEIIMETVHTYYGFIKGMCIVYLIVGILNSVGLLLLGIPHPFLFGFLASILTFIPYVGIMIASLLPISVAWLTYDSFWYPMGVVFIFAFVQYLEANVIFPVAVSARLNINTLVTIMAILIGGVLWGAAGMILFVPFIAILKLIADRVPDLKSLAMFLGSEPSGRKVKVKK